MRRVRNLLFVVIALLAPATSHAAAVGESGALFLRVGMGAKASGMGEAFTAVAEDASSVYWNPGAMAAVLGTQVMLMHNEYFQSVRLEQAALTHETDWGTFGLSFTGLYLDQMDRYDDVATSQPLGQFSAFDVSFALGYARYIIPNLAIGVSVKSIHENIDDVTANGWAFDAGLYHISRVEGLKLAATVHNLGSPMKFEDNRFTGQEFALPRSAKLGASYEREIETLRGGILATFDLVFPNDSDSPEAFLDSGSSSSSFRQHIGLEYGYRKAVFVRAGFKGGYDSQGATFGLGVVYRLLGFDYAMQMVDNDLGDSHRFGLTLKL